MKNLLILVISIVSISTLNAQIPNSGFENWIDDITPQEWGTNNFPSVWTTVSRTSTAHSGSFAAKLEIANFNGGPMFPVLSTTFQVNQIYTSLNGYYQFHPTSNEVVFAIFAFFFKDGGLSASGVLEIETASESYSSFNMLIEGSNEIADSVMLQIQILSESTTDPGIGSYALIDQLSFGQTTDIEYTDQLPLTFNLAQNYPNPFNPSTKISWQSPIGSHQTLKVYDVLGKEAATLVNEEKPAGIYEVDFNANGLSSGVYFYQLRSGDFVQTNKMILLR
jgi:hypothetical protein